MLRTLLLAICGAGIAAAVHAQEPIRFARTPDISPDGQQIAFSYLGDIWTVDAIGGVARPVTMHEAHDLHPVFSPDGRWIAFSSSRHGSYDVFVVSARGGKPQRLTFDSAADLVRGWSPDGSQVLFASTRGTGFPPGMTLFSVPARGGAERALPFPTAKDIAISPKGDAVAYVAGPGLWYRKGYRGSSNDDIWLAAPDGTNHRRLTEFNGQDTSPMWSPDGKRIYYVSEHFGTSNIVFRDLSNPDLVQKLTSHSDESVRKARISGDGKWIVYECGADLWVVSTPGGSPRKIAIEVYADDKVNTERLTTFTTGASSYAVSPDDKYIAFAVHGELFMIPQAGGKATRLTHSPTVEHSPVWSPDGKKLLFLSDRNGHENLYQLEADDPEQSEFGKAVRFKPRALTDSKDGIAGVSFSPDGKRIAFLRSGRLWTMNSDGGDVKEIVRDTLVVDYDWSPDGKHFVYARLDASWGSELFIVPSSGGKAENVTRYATANFDVSWSSTGMKLAFLSERPGPGGMMQRPYVLNLQKPAAAHTPATTEIDWEDIHLRATPVAQMGASAVAISPDGSKVAFRSGDDLWLVGSDGTAAMRVSAGTRPEQIRWSHKSSTILYFRDRSGQIRVLRMAFGPPAGEPPVIPFTAKMTIRRDEEFAEVFQQSWRLLSESFYDAKHHGADWNAVRARYQPLVKHVAMREDMHTLISLMLGELNASHLGIMGPKPQPDEFTAELGILFDPNHRGDGLKVAEVLKRGPADKRGLNLKPGEIIIAIDRTPVTANTNLSQLLNGKINETVLLDVMAVGATDPKDPKGRRRIEVQATDRDQISRLMYERWTERNAKRVAELSGGKFGYIHIPSMDQPGLDRFVRALYSDCFDKEAIVLDVRYNGGGFTHDQVLNYLTGKEHTLFRPREGGEGLVLRPYDRKWTKPLVLLINNQSYSDAEIFPSAFRTMGLGKLVGQPTGGFVIATSSVSLIDGSFLRLPRIGVYTAKGINMEKEGVVPDILVEPHPEQLAKGIDVQLDKAVETVQKDVIAWKQARNPTPPVVVAPAPKSATTPMTATPMTTPMPRK